MTTSILSAPPDRPAPASSSSAPPVMTVLLTGGKTAERDRLSDVLLEQGVAVCSVASLELAAEAMRTFTRATGECFDVLYALCDEETSIDGLSQGASLASEVVALRERPWSADEVSEAFALGNVLLFDTRSD